MSTWGLERIDKLRSHAPSQGRESRVYLSLLAKGERIRPIEQDLVAAGFTGLVTVTAVTATSSYVLVVAGTSYTVVAGSTDTKKTVANKLMALINQSASHRAVNLRSSSGNWLFNVIGQATFSLANTGTTTAGDLTVGSVAGSSTAIARGATTITLPFAIRGKIPAGQWLQFVDPSGFEYLAKITITAQDGATTLNVAAIEEVIPAGSTCIYPPELTDRREASINDSYEWEGFRTFNTDGFEDAVFTGSSAEIALGGLYYEFDAGYRTISEGIRQGREFYAIVEYGNQREGYTKPRKEAVVGFANKEQPLSVDGLIEGNFSGKCLSPSVELFSVLDA
ncbi:MAG: hypothetical protein SFT94_02210 [Pseudanabaenaceae cyanobacterium bins.68]|nr:hypothetical protein [Pseudanabaenaceae cyanobacterium bins.68]